MAKGGHWVPADIKDVKESYKFEGHSPRKLTKRIPMVSCQYCGLVYLKNKFTKWCIRMGCMHELHNQYKQQLRRAGKG